MDAETRKLIAEVQYAAEYALEPLKGISARYQREAAIANLRAAIDALEADPGWKAGEE